MGDSSLPDIPEEEGPLPAGARLGKYQIVRLLGAGGMGAVYEATHSEIGKRVAIKTLSPAVAAIPGARQRFLREAQLTSRLSHPNIVDLTDMGTEGRTAYLVMEMLKGEDLSHRLERTGPMVPRELVDLMLPVCSALLVAHEAGIVHRDLKPQNIFLESGVQGIVPKVLDFGISKSSDTDAASSLTGTGSVIGTPHYLAPEQIKDARTAGPASDQYSIGVILYRCLSNANPFESDSLFGILQAIVTERPMPLLQRRPDLPKGLVDIVERAMNRLPRERFPSVRHLGRALLAYASPKARVIWEDTFPEGDPVPAPVVAPAPPRTSHTLPAQGPSPRPLAAFDSGTLSPAISSTEDRGARRGGAITGIVAGVAIAVGGFLLFTRGSRAPEPPPAAAAAPAPLAATPPPAAPPTAPVAAPVPIAPAPAPVAPAKDEPKEAAKAGDVKSAETTEKTPEKTPATRRKSSAHRGTRAAPASSRGTNPYGAAVLD